MSMMVTWDNAYKMLFTFEHAECSTAVTGFMVSQVLDLDRKSTVIILKQLSLGMMETSAFRVYQQFNIKTLVKCWKHFRIEVPKLICSTVPFAEKKLVCPEHLPSLSGQTGSFTQIIHIATTGHLHHSSISEQIAYWKILNMIMYGPLNIIQVKYTIKLILWDNKGWGTPKRGSEDLGTH